MLRYQPGEWEGGAPTPRSPILCEGQSEGPEPREVEGTGRMRETGAPSTGEVAKVLSRVCSPHGGSHGRTTRGPAQHFEGAKRRPRYKEMGVERGQGHYEGRDLEGPRPV